MRDCSQFLVVDGRQSMWQVGMRQSFSNGRHAESTETSELEKVKSIGRDLSRPVYGILRASLSI